MMHIYLSPHLDDAVLSCGGAIHRRTSSGERVRVITIFSGEFKGSGLSPFALEQHEIWGNPPQPMALRRAEDLAALTLLGAGVRHLDYLDAVYRADPRGQWMYTGVGMLFGELHPADPMAQNGAKGLADRLARTDWEAVGLISTEDQAVIYGPLGVGRHVDHQIVHAAARQLGARGYRVAFYEDYPYAEEPGALESALAAAGAESWRLQIIPLDPADLRAQVSALGYYRSQLAILFGGAEAMLNRVWSFALARCPERGLCERIWWPPEA